jgi:hypothetical protein
MEEYEQVPVTSQDKPGKIRRRLETCEDAEMEQSKSPYFSLDFENIIVAGHLFKLLQI